MAPPQKAGRTLAAADKFLAFLNGARDIGAIHSLVEGVGDAPFQQVLDGFLAEQNVGRTTYRAPQQ